MSHLKFMSALGFKPLGFWADDNEEAGLPRPHDFVDTSWDPHIRTVVQIYLDQSVPELLSVCGGHSPCRLCDRSTNGCAEHSDGLYLWPSGLTHYLSAHAVKPPQDFIDHVLAQRGVFPTQGLLRKITKDRKSVV